MIANKELNKMSLLELKELMRELKNEAQTKPFEESIRQKLNVVRNRILDINNQVRNIKYK